MTDPTQDTVKVNALNRMENWFYQMQTPYALALVRITFPLAMLVAFIPRWRHVRELYSTDGSPTPFWWSYGYTDLLPIFPPEVATALFTIMVILLCSVSIGWKTRPSLLILSLLIPYFGLLDSLGTLTKYTAVSFHVSLLLSFSGCRDVWSVDSWLTRRRTPNWTPPQSPVWPQRLIQLLICFVYLGSAATKTHTEGFFTGDQMYYWSLTNVNFPNPVGEWLSLYPSFLVISGMLAATWELLFIFLVWNKSGRNIMLGLGVLFHLMTYFMLGLLVFPLLFFALYCCFLHEEEAKKLGTFCSSVLPKKSSQLLNNGYSIRFASWSAFTCLLVVSSMVSIAAERRLDVYQERSSNGPLTLQPLSAEAVQEILRNDTQVEIKDQLYSIDVGTQSLGGYIANPKTRFAAGENLKMQVRLIQPHHDLWVEYELRDPENMVIARDGTLAPRNESKKLFNIPLGEQLSAGEYQLQVQLNGFNAGTRKIYVE